MNYKRESPGIYIKPIGGLCNRMRAIDSAISLSKKTNSDLHIIWDMNSELNCRFEDLWTIPPSIKTLTSINRKTKIGKLIQKFYRKKIGGFIQNLYFRYFLGHFDLVLTYSQMESYHQKNYTDCNFEEMVANKRVLITTLNRFYTSTHPFDPFVPVDHLQKIINAQVGNFSNVIGVHIRRTDNQNAKAYSSTAKFIELMKAEVQNNRNVMFFVATDSPWEAENLKKIFPNRIITYEKKSLDRNDSSAIQDALIDLYCLSRCRKLIGSYWSSFSGIAHQINEIEYVVAK